MLKSIHPAKEFWIYLLPVAVLFQIFYFFEIPASILSVLIKVIFFTSCAHLIYYIFKNKSEIPKSDLWFLGLFFVFLLFNGAYLEYPSDPWEYFRLIVQWKGKTLLSEGSAFNRYFLDPPRYAYFFYWSLIDWLPLTQWKGALNFISAGTQILALYQLLILSRFWTHSKTYQYIYTTACYLFIGYANLSYFRYLSLSANILSFSLFYLFQWKFLNLSSSYFNKPSAFSFQKEWKTFISLGLILVLIYWTHNQAILFSFFSALSILSYYLFTSPKNRKLSALIFLFLILASLWVIIWKQESFIGTLQRNWKLSADTFSMPILLALFVSLFYFKEKPLFIWMHLFSILIFIFPISHYLLFKHILPYEDVSHRLHYIAPFGFLISFVVLRLFERWKSAAAMTLLALFLFSLNPWRPWFGRLEHILRPVSPELSLQFIDPVVEWFRVNRSETLSRCRYATDQVTDFVFMTYFAWPNINLRIQDQTFLFEENVLWAGHTNSNQFCGVLLHLPGESNNNLQPKEVISPINRKLHHWESQFSQVQLATTPVMRTLAAELQNNPGWKITKLPSDYFLFEKN